MARIKESTVYQFEELSESAKERARDWFRAGIDVTDYAEPVLEDAARMGALLGIDIRTRPVQLMGGGKRIEPSVYFDLGRGSYASVEGFYRYAKGSVRAIMAEAPQDTDLHTIARDLQVVQRRNFYGITASLSHGRETTRIDVESDRPMTTQDEEAIEQSLRDFTSWIHDSLTQEYEYQTSQEAIDETIKANEYEFNENGTRA